MEIAVSELDKQIGDVKSRISAVSMKVFGYGDGLTGKLDPEITTIRPNMLPIYETAPTHPQRLSVFLDTVSNVIGDDVEIFEEEVVTGEQIHKLMVLDVLVKCGIPLIKKTSDETFSVMIKLFEDDNLPQSLTSEAEIARLRNTMAGDLDLSFNLKEGAVNSLGESGIDFKDSSPAVQKLIDGLVNRLPISEVLERLSRLD